MHRKQKPRMGRMLSSAAVAALLLTQVGCVGLLTNLLYPGHLIPAAYTGAVWALARSMFAEDLARHRELGGRTGRNGYQANMREPA